MSQAFSKKDSPGKVYRGTRRHLRLARRTGNATAIELAERIREPRDALGTALDVHAAAQEATQDAFDDWVQADRTLDRTVKSADRKCVDWDADHPGAETRSKLLGGKTGSQIAASARTEEPDLVAQVVRRGAMLPEDHPAIPLLARMTEQTDASRAAHRAWLDAARAEAVAAADVEVAKLQVTRVYLDNQIDIERACGSTVAEACFPTLRFAKADDEEEPVAP